MSSCSVTATSDMFADLMEPLAPKRRAHSAEVGRKVACVVALAPASFRPDLVAAALLHDIGYAHPVTGFHPLDGAAFLAGKAFSPLICHLVAVHSLSALEAEVRGISPSAYDRYKVDVESAALRRLEAILCWADMTTGPDGETVTVEDRLDEIVRRYGPNHVVTRFIEKARPVLLASGQSPLSMYGSE